MTLFDFTLLEIIIKMLEEFSFKSVQVCFSCCQKAFALGFI